MDYYWPPSLLLGVPLCNHQEKKLARKKKKGAPRGRGLSKKSAQHCRTTAATAAAAARPPRHHHEFCSVAWPPTCGASAHSTYVVSSGEEACQVGGRRSSPRPPATLAYWLASMALSCCLLPGGQKIKASSSSHRRQRLQTGTRSRLPPCGLLSQQGGVVVGWGAMSGADQRGGRQEGCARARCCERRESSNKTNTVASQAQHTRPPLGPPPAGGAHLAIRSSLSLAPPPSGRLRWGGSGACVPLPPPGALASAAGARPAAPSGAGRPQQAPARCPAGCDLHCEGPA